MYLGCAENREEIRNVKKSEKSTLIIIFTFLVGQIKMWNVEETKNTSIREGRLDFNSSGDKSIWTLCLNIKIERNSQKHLTLLLFETDWIKYIITQNPYLFFPLHCLLSLKCGKEWQGKVTMFLFVSSIRELEERQPIWRWNLGMQRIPRTKANRNGKKEKQKKRCGKNTNTQRNGSTDKIYF